MKLSVFGLGYVGCVSAACFAKEGHDVMGVDVNPTKVEIVNRGETPIVETGISELVREMVVWRRLRATTDVEEAIASADASLVCVGTPSNVNGSLDLTYVERVCLQIGSPVKAKRQRHVVVIRSSMLRGTMQGLVVTS